MASTKRQIVLSTALLSLATAISVALYLVRPPTDIEEPAKSIVTVDVARVVKQDIRIQIQAQGTVTPLKKTAILSEVRGRVVEVAEYEPKMNVTPNAVALKDD